MYKGVKTGSQEEALASYFFCSKFLHHFAEGAIKGRFLFAHVFFIIQLNITPKSATTNIMYCTVPGVGRHKVIKPPRRRALTIFIDIRSFSYRNRIYRTSILKRALSSVKRKINSYCVFICNGAFMWPLVRRTTSLQTECIKILHCHARPQA